MVCARKTSQISDGDENAGTYPAHSKLFVGNKVIKSTPAYRKHFSRFVPADEELVFR